MALTVIFIALPVKLLAFVTMNKQGWLTRRAGQIGGDGQSAASLTRPVLQPVAASHRVREEVAA